MNLTFKGGKEFARFLQKLPQAVSAEILEMSLTAGAQIVQQSAQEKCPKPAVRRRPGTVRLSDSIRVSTVEKDAAHAVVNVGSNSPTAHLVEYGHQIVPRGPTRKRVSVTRVSRTGRTSTRFVVDPDERRRTREPSGGFVAPRPFLRPAFDEHREAVVHRVGEVMGKEVERAARLIAGTAA